MACEGSERVLAPGKVPSGILARVLDLVRCDCEELVVPPALGEDAAVLRLRGGLVAVTSDPITFRTPDPGRFAICVNANDVAVMGARPQYGTVVAMLPPGTTGACLMGLMAELAAAARDYGVALVGGHTEVTEAVRWPVLSVTLFGRLVREDPLRTGGARPGDEVLQVGPLAVEGTAILAAEHGARLRAALGDALVDRALGFLESPGICVVGPALRLAAHGTVHALHDPTEGGLATGLAEMAQAAGLGVCVEEARLVRRPETDAICGCLGYDALGLISSGCLLAAVAPSAAGPVLAELEREGYAAACIGQFTEDRSLVLLGSDGVRRPLPAFAVDELAR